MAIANLVSKIDKVKVYSDGSTITRIAAFPEISWAERDRSTVEFAEVEIAGLPLALDDSSLRLRVESLSDAAIPLLVTDVRIGLTAPPPPEEQMASLEDEIKAAQIEVDRLEHNLLALIENEISILQGLALPDRPEGEPGKAPPSSPTGARLVLESFKNEQLRLRVQEKREVKAKLYDAQEHLRELEQQQALASSARTVKAHELRKTAIAKLACRDRTALLSLDWASCQLVLEYFIPGARWVPTYICRLDSATNTASIAVRALICQRTHEDWTGVHLELSTAIPTTWCELPELPSLRLGRAQPEPRKLGWRSVPAGAEVLFEDYERQKKEASIAIARGSTYEALELPKFTKLSEIEKSQIPSGLPHIPDLPKSLQNRHSFAAGAGISSPSDDFSDMEVMTASFSSPSPQPASTLLSRVSMAAPQKAKALTSQEVYSPEPEGDRSLVEAIDYAWMRLGSPDEPQQRGKLTIGSQVTTYLEILRRLPVTLYFNVMKTVQEANQLAISCRSLSLPAKSANVRQEAHSFDYTYVGQGRVDIPSDGQFHSVALTSQTADVDVRYVVVPREDTNVFRIAQLQNPLQAPLLRGAADVYVDGEYVLLTQIPTIPPRGKIELGLGVEQGIKVARNTTFGEVRSGETLVAFNELRHSIQIAISNRLDREIAIEVRDRIPVPQPEAKVDVQITQVSPPWQKYSQEERGRVLEGGYRWQVQIPANRDLNLEASYTAKTFIDSELVGGNRREE
ncbi:DUF4139 domain-containing protein [Tumidithrix elongata RA019]|uniref:DUF4139 domain-containing protein n=1 Tax=Tumidithrix elongata BACA0141 TaxID=2716417 RepID=A0AAW9PRB4_9CYAN|nr:DUF4139 domain-containing protein [Tumidithrix elongata RA019]